MENASSALGAPGLAHPQSAFDSGRDPFNATSRRGPENEQAESWNAGGNNSNSPMGRPSNNHNVGGSTNGNDMTLHSIQSGEGLAPLGGKKKRFVCPHCTRAFARSGHLQRHERSHTNERPFSCPQCSSAFGRLDTLLRHERTLHGSSTSAASNNPTQYRSSSFHSPKRLIPNRSNIAISQMGHTVQSLDPQVTRFHESPTMNHHSTNQSPPTMPGPSSINHNSESPSLILSDTRFSPPSNPPTDLSPSIVPPILAYPAPHTPAFSPLPESPAPWDSLTASEIILLPSLASETQAQMSRLLFNLLPSGPSTPSTPGAVLQTPTRPSATSNLDFFIHSPSPMSFPLSSERGAVVPTQAAAISTPINTYPPSNKTAFLKNLDDFDRGVLETYIAECDRDTSLAGFDLPKKDALSRYLYSYFECLHQHHPFIHTATFDPASIKVPLFLSMCCIGALYRFERDASLKLHIAARKLICSHLENKSDEASREVWVIQTLFLTMVFAAYSGDSKIFERGLALQSALGNLLRYQAEIVRIEEERLKASSMSWEQWIPIEGFKRIYYSVFCFFSQLTMTFDLPPAITNTEPHLSLPCSEAEWRASDSDSWNVLHTSPNAPPTPSYSDALRDLFTPTDDSNLSIRYSHFGSFVMINAICLQLWTHLKLRNVETDIKLTVIEHAIDQWQRAWCADPDCSMSPTSPHGPLSFNATALYRMANVRLFRDYSRVKASFQFLDVDRIIPVMVQDVSGSGWTRSQEMIRAIMPATLQLQIPVKMGTKLVARTAALTWSVEHALCAVDSGLLLYDWLRSIENDTSGMVLGHDEQKVLNLVKELLAEAEVSIADGERLSAATLNVWAATLDEVWVWGLTPVLARVLRRLAEEIQDSAHDGQKDMTLDPISRMDPPPVSYLNS